jgi:Domain of unknown function (DUF5134)
MTPGWILDVFAAVMVAVVAVSAARLAAARPWQHGAVITDTDIAHLLMAIAMAGMLSPGLATVPDHGWQVIFALMTAWFAYRVVREARTDGVRALAGGHCAPHLVHSAAMLYMFVALTAPAAGGSGMGSMAGSSGPGGQTLSSPALALAFGLILAGYTVWDLDQLSGTRHAFAIAPVTLARPAAAGGLTLAAARHAPLTGAAVTTAAAAPQGTAAETAAATDAVRAGGAAREAGPAAFLLSPGMTVSCRIAMGVTMALMLFLMI